MLAVARHHETGLVAGAFHDGQFLLSIDTDVDRIENIDEETPAADRRIVLRAILGDIYEVRQLVRCFLASRST